VPMLALRAARAFDGERSIAGPVTVITENGKIKAVEQGHPDVTGAEVVDLGTATVLPGLVDTHVHLCADSENGALDRLPEFTSEHLDAVIADGLDRQLKAGVTTVRDLGDRAWAVVDQRDRHRQRVLASGPPITSPRGHCWSMGGEASGDEALRSAVRERAERRVDVVKVMASGGFATPGTIVDDCQFTEHDLRVVIEEAHSLGLPVTAHALGDMIEAGVPNAVVLASATSAAARACGVGKGVLKPGWDADVIAVQGDPMRDITALHHVTTVVIGGQMVTTVLPTDRRE
jgi:imidazolonepropionase-like amidohydrolase